MPCIACGKNKWKYGEHGKCVFNSLEACKKAAALIHIQDEKSKSDKYLKKTY
jgi:hypothetical protein